MKKIEHRKGIRKAKVNLGIYKTETAFEFEVVEIQKTITSLSWKAIFQKIKKRFFKIVFSLLSLLLNHFSAS